MSTRDTQMNQYLNTIAEAVHGRDMRSAIHDGLEKTYNDAYTWFDQSLGNANQALRKASEALEIAEPMGDDIQEIKDLADELDTKYDETNERVNNIIAHNNDTDGNSELIDLRTTYDGQVKSSAGSAVRNQISALNSRVDNLVREQSTGELEDCHAKPVYVPLYENQSPTNAFAAQTLQISLPGSLAPSLAKYAFIKITFKDSNLFGAGVRSVYIPNPGKDAEETNVYTSDGSVTMPADGTYGISSYSRKFTAALSSNDTVLNIMFTDCEKIATDNPFAINNSDMTISDPSSTATTDNEYLIPYEVFLIDYVLDGEIEVDKDTELIDIRNGEDGTTYQSAGAAVRGQVGQLKSALTSIMSGTRNINKKAIGRFKYSNNSVVASNDTFIGMSDIEECKAETTYSFSFYNTDNEVCYVRYIDSTKTLIDTETIGATSVHQFTTPANTAYVHISSYKSGGIALNDNTVLQIEEGVVITPYIDGTSAQDDVSRETTDFVNDTLYQSINPVLTNGYLNDSGGITDQSSSLEVTTQKFYAKKFKNFIFELEYSQNRNFWLAYSTYASDGSFIQKVVTSYRGKSKYGLYIPSPINAKYIAFSWRTYGESNILSLIGGVSTKSSWNGQICDFDLNKGISTAKKPFAFKPLYDHMFVTTSAANITIPHESIYHIRLSRLFGFNVIEANVHATSDGKYIVNHLSDGKFGGYFHHVDGTTDISDIAVSSVTWDWIVNNVRYNSTIPKYRTRPCNLNEFLAECKMQNIIPFVTSNDKNIVQAVTKVMGDDFIAYSGDREKTPNAILYHWKNLSTKAEIVSHCEYYGKPFIYGMSNASNFTDEELKDIVDTLHEKGFMIGTAYNDANWYKYVSIGFDCFAGIDQINRLDNGNIVNFDSTFGFGDYNYTNATETNGVLTYSANGTISPNVLESDNGLYAIDLEIVFDGSITIPSKGEFGTTVYSSDGSIPVFVAIPIINGNPQISISVTSGTKIYDCKFKASKI